MGRACKATLESLTESLFAGPITFGQRFVDQRDRRLIFRLLVAENAPLRQRDAQRLEIIRRHRIEVGESLLSATLGNKWPYTVFVKRGERRQRDGFHSR